MLKIIAAAMVLLAGSAHAQSLDGRDFNGDGTADGYYDTAQNITWMADANLYNTLGGPLNVSPFSWPSSPSYLAPGELRLQNAFTFLDGLSVSGISGWRLPERLIPAGDPTGTNYRCNATACDPSAYWPTELTNMLGVQSDLSLFSNVQNGNYMSFSGGAAGQLSYVTWNNPINGYNFVTYETGLVWGYVWAVHDGDVGQALPVTPIPEPSTYALMVAGLMGLGMAMRRRSTGVLPAP